MLTVLYLRLSKEDGDREESNSIESQRQMLTNYVEEHPDMELYREYVDDGYTGTNYNRPGFQAMLADAEEKEIDCIVVKDLSRLGRNYLETGRYIQQIFPNLGVRFIAVNDQIDTGNESQQGFDMMLPIRNIFNESYSQDISHKVQSSFKAMQKAGAFCGAYASFGYRKNPADKHKLVIDPYAAEVVRNIYDWYLAGMGQRTIAAKLNEAGIPCPSVYKKLNGENYRNSKRLESTSYWTYSSVHKILENEMYRGNMVQNKSVRKMRGKAKQRPKEEWIVVQGTHEAIIEPEKWKRTQELLKKRTRTIDFSQNIGIFSGFLKCADCGRALVKRQFCNNAGKKNVFYTCGAYARSGTKVCSNHYIRHEVLERIVLDDLNTVIENVQDIKELVDRQREEAGKDMQLEERETQLVKERLQKVRHIKQDSYYDYKEGLLSKDEYLKVRADCLDQEEMLEKKLDILINTQKDGKKNMLDSSWVKNLLEHERLDSLDRNTLVEFLEKIEIGERDENNQQKITIHYRFSDELKDLFQIVYTDV